MTSALRAERRYRQSLRFGPAFLSSRNRGPGVAYTYRARRQTRSAQRSYSSAFVTVAAITSPGLSFFAPLPAGR